MPEAVHALQNDIASHAAQDVDQMQPTSGNA